MGARLPKELIKTANHSPPSPATSCQEKQPRALWLHLFLQEWYKDSKPCHGEKSLLDRPAFKSRVTQACHPLPTARSTLCFLMVMTPVIRFPRPSNDKMRKEKPREVVGPPGVTQLWFLTPGPSRPAPKAWEAGHLAQGWCYPSLRGLG